MTMTFSDDMNRESAALYKKIITDLRNECSFFHGKSPNSLEKFMRQVKEEDPEENRRAAASYWLERQERSKTYHAKAEENRKALKAKLQEEHGVPEDHPRADKLFELAWQYGHAFGETEVSNHYEEFLALLVL